MATAPQVIAIGNRKGGTGKTTVSVNLSAELAAQGQRVLLVDLDSQGHCAVGLGVKERHGAPTAHDIFVDAEARLADAVQETCVPGLALAPADRAFEHGSGQRDPRRLARALADESLAGRFDIVIVDTPPSLDHLLLNALSAANWLLVPYIPHHLAYEGVRQLMRVLFKVMSDTNPDLKILGFLPTMAAERVRQHRAINGEVSRQFGAHRVLPAIRSDIRLAEAFAAGRPGRGYAPGSRGVEDFADLAARLAPLLRRPGRM